MGKIQKYIVKCERFIKDRLLPKKYEPVRMNGMPDFY